MPFRGSDDIAPGLLGRNPQVQLDLLGRERLELLPLA